MADHLLKLSGTQLPARVSSGSRHSSSSSFKAEPASVKSAEKPMVSQQELLKLLERDFKSSEDVKNHADQRKEDFDQEWGLATDAEDDFSPVNR